MPTQGFSVAPQSVPPRGSRRITSTIPAINLEQRDLVQIPPGSVVEICPDSDPMDGMLEVVWKDKKYALFRVDLDSRSESYSR